MLYYSFGFKEINKVSFYRCIGDNRKFRFIQHLKFDEG